VAGRIRSIEKSNDLIGIRTRDLPACSVVPQPTTYQISHETIILKNRKEFYLIEYNGMQAGENQPAFRRDIQLPSSGRIVSQERNQHEAGSKHSKCRVLYVTFFESIILFTAFYKRKDTPL
jgi:hypothetical protein